MFDIGALELLLIVIVAIIVIGPKDMPQALRMAGKWVGKIRRASAQFRSGFDNLVREAEMEEMEKKWKEQNAKIMAETPKDEMGPLHEGDLVEGPSGEHHGASSVEECEVQSDKPADLLKDAAGGTRHPNANAVKVKSSADEPTDEPMLPLGKSGGN